MKPLLTLVQVPRIVKSLQSLQIATRLLADSHYVS